MKSISRIAAVQTIYQFEISKNTADVDLLLLDIKNFYKNKDLKNDYELSKSTKLKIRPSYNYLDRLVRFTHNNLQEVDRVIEIYLINSWNLISLGRLLLAILRVAICEIKYFLETPKKVILSEYTDIANNMLDNNQIGFVNSVLDRYASSGCR